MAYASMQKSKGKPCTDITLLDYVSNVNSILGMEITLVVVGFDKYQRSVKESVMCNPELKKMYRQVSKTVAEEVATEVQFKGFCHFSFLKQYA
ncbi:crossover junction endonuclease EME1 [Caerostris extrusa]|uniref:Crossover junction endonuclease EME1 n=1 Tax=Caerostris extrusa TaxID=172846 RepID=A0AAV4QNB8_CAEEX|nr:crossover junction endonuclease EME1 [Caerostris extrusa]